MGLYEVSLSMSLFRLWDGDYVSQLPYVVVFLLRAVLNIFVRYASPRGPMCFRCLIFNLSGPYELLI